MRKKKILFCTEATFLHTGYATYSKEVLKYLHKTGKYDIAEYSAYAQTNDPRHSNTPWKTFGVMPNSDDPENIKKYKSNIRGQFGGFSFEKTCLEFQPDIVCDIRDYWMVEFAYKSPFRKFFKWALMPTVDATPQAREWISAYANADACFSYSDWSGKILEQQSGGKVKYLGSAPPSASQEYQPMDKQEMKSQHGIDPNVKIIGTVMRNQRRKLYPDLFKSFKEFINKVDNPNEYRLYCHTSFPDAGWNIPELLVKNGIASHVLFTYVCTETKRCFASPFVGAKAKSPFSNKDTAVLCSVKNGLSTHQLASIVNMFDLYIQYANSEGFGLPQVEAAACAVPVMSVDYSAMSSVIRQLDGIPLKPKAMYKEMETGCMRAVPDNKLTAKNMINFFNKTEEERKLNGENSRNKFLEHFQWDKTGAVWEKYFDSVEPIPQELTWKSAPRILQPDKMSDELESCSTEKFASWLYDRVLHEPTEKSTIEYSHMMTNLMYGYSTSQTIGSYFDEDNSIISFGRKIEQKEYTRQQAYQEMESRRKYINTCEDMRKRTFNL